MEEEELGVDGPNDRCDQSDLRDLSSYSTVDYIYIYTIEPEPDQHRPPLSKGKGFGESASTVEEQSKSC